MQQIFKFASDPEFGGRNASVEENGEQLAQFLVYGMDIWLNKLAAAIGGLRYQRHEGLADRGAPPEHLGWLVD